MGVIKHQQKRVYEVFEYVKQKKNKIMLKDKHSKINSDSNIKLLHELAIGD